MPINDPGNRAHALCRGRTSRSRPRIIVSGAPCPADRTAGTAPAATVPPLHECRRRHARPRTAPRCCGTGSSDGLQLIAAEGSRVLYGDRIRSRGLDCFGQVPRMVGESGSMSGRRILPHQGGGILIAAPAGARIVVPDCSRGRRWLRSAGTSELMGQVNDA
jgi:hypothetical protein